MLFSDPPDATSPSVPTSESTGTSPLAALWAHVVKDLKTRISPDAYDRWFSSLALTEANDERIRLRVPDSIHQLWIEMNYLAPLKESFRAITGILPTLEFSSGDAAQAAAPEAPAKPKKPAPRPVKTAAPALPESPRAASLLPPSDRAFSAPTFPIAPSMDDAGITVPGFQIGDLPMSPVIPAEAEYGMDATLPSNFPLEADPTATEEEHADGPGDLISPRHTFSTYVVGANNQFAHAAATAVAQRPARAYNPLFFYGGTGLGKTHLMHAIGAHIRGTRPKARVLYITSEEFTNQFIAALQEHSLPRFRKRFRQADVLLIDDVQFLAGKERSQEEFFHTFNALFDGNKQVVLSSDCPPSEMRNLESRLASRFEWGMMAEITPPDEETRVAILRNRAVSLRVDVPPTVINYLASRIRSNVRRLHGALFRVASWISLHGPITMQQTEDLLRDLLQEESRQAITIDKIQKTIAESYDIRLADMTSRKRPANIAFARQVAMYLARELTGSSYQEIGDAFGGRDHGTIMHACRSIDAKIKEEENIRLKIDALATAMRRAM
ncbi:MAG: chromosomal replication initiator protein DnaA [Verrucomicrobiales bacterium]|nr:chromosomal replication initiator protein DnaA [Verrucomicrobiales bacterium]